MQTKDHVPEAPKDIRAQLQQEDGWKHLPVRTRLEVLKPDIESALSNGTSVVRVLDILAANGCGVSQSYFYNWMRRKKLTTAKGTPSNSPQAQSARVALRGRPRSVPKKKNPFETE